MDEQETPALSSFSPTVSSPRKRSTDERHSARDLIGPTQCGKTTLGRVSPSIGCALYTAPTLPVTGSTIPVMELAQFGAARNT